MMVCVEGLDAEPGAVGLTTDLPKSRVPEKRPPVKEKELEIASQFEF